MHIHLGESSDKKNILVDENHMTSMSIDSRPESSKYLLNRYIITQMSEFKERLLVVDPKSDYSDLVNRRQDHTRTDLIGMVNTAGSLVYSGQQTLLFIDDYSTLTRNLSKQSMNALEDALVYLHKHSHDSGVWVVISNSTADLHLPYKPKSYIYVGGFDMLNDTVRIPEKFYARTYAAIRKSRLIDERTQNDHGVIITDIIRKFIIDSARIRTDIPKNDVSSLVL